MACGRPCGRAWGGVEEGLVLKLMVGLVGGGGGTFGRGHGGFSGWIRADSDQWRLSRRFEVVGWVGGLSLI